jgi:hypothetical protein
MNKLIPSASITVIIVAALITASGTAMAHPGHSILEQVHGFIHAEHLFVLVAITGFILVKFITKNRL